MIYLECKSVTSKQAHNGCSGSDPRYMLYHWTPAPPVECPQRDSWKAVFPPLQYNTLGLSPYHPFIADLAETRHPATILLQFPNNRQRSPLLSKQAAVSILAPWRATSSRMGLAPLLYCPCGAGRTNTNSGTSLGYIQTELLPDNLDLLGHSNCPAPKTNSHTWKWSFMMMWNLTWASTVYFSWIS